MPWLVARVAPSGGKHECTSWLGVNSLNEPSGVECRQSVV